MLLVNISGVVGGRLLYMLLSFRRFLYFLAIYNLNKYNLSNRNTDLMLTIIIVSNYTIIIVTKFCLTASAKRPLFSIDAATECDMNL